MGGVSAFSRQRQRMRQPEVAEVAAMEELLADPQFEDAEGDLEDDFVLAATQVAASIAGWRNRGTRPACALSLMDATSCAVDRHRHLNPLPCRRLRRRWRRQRRRRQSIPQALQRLLQCAATAIQTTTRCA